MSDQMEFTSATFTDQDANVDAAVTTLTGQVERQLDGTRADLVMAFLSAEFVVDAATVARGLYRALRPGLLLGCVAAGVIGAQHEIERKPAITLLAARLPDVDLVPFELPIGDWRWTLQARSSLQRVITSPDTPGLFLMLADPFTSPMGEVLGAFNEFYPGVPVVGGMASASPEPGGNVLLLNDRVLSSGLIGVTLSGAFQADTIVSQGCRPVAHPFTVTSAERNVVFGIEGQPPLVHVHDLMRRLPPADMQLLRSKGLYIGRAIATHQRQLGRGDFLVRGIMGIDRESGAITVQDFIKEGETVQFHLRDAATAREDLEMMLQPQTLYAPPRGGLLFTCNGRGRRLYGYPDGDVSIIQNVLEDVPLAGFFCAGEIGPVGDKNFVHGHTASLVLFRDA